VEKSLEPEVEQRLSAWMKRAQDGDREAYERLLTELIPHLRRFICRQLKNSEGVDDVMQDVLIAIHRDRHTYDPTRSFVSWTYAIARHRVVDWVRRRRRWLAFQELEPTPGELAPCPAPLGEYSALQRFQRAFARLSPTQREVIQLLKLEGWSVRRVAESLGRTESAIKVSAHRGYQALRGLLAMGPDEG
jgi:RNA polymerase sigma-70 factor (ECF subfamily)